MYLSTYILRSRRLELTTPRLFPLYTDPEVITLLFRFMTAVPSRASAIIYDPAVNIDIGVHLVGTTCVGLRHESYDQASNVLGQEPKTESSGR